MRPDFDLRTEIAAAVTAGDGAVRFLARFAEAIGRPLKAGDGYPVEELEQAQQRLGVVLPTGLRELLGLAGRRNDLVQVQDRLLAPHEWLLWVGEEDDFADNRELDAEAIDVLNSVFVRLPLPDYPMWTEPEPGGPTVRWFAGYGTVLRDDGDTWAWVRAESARALQTVRELLPGDWLMQPSP